MNFDEAFKDFKSKYISTPRVINIVENQFGVDDITVLFYDKYDKTPPLNISSWENFPVSMCGMFQLRDFWEKIYDMHVLDVPASWEEVVPMSTHYKSISRQIAEYEMRNK